MWMNCYEKKENKKVKIFSMCRTAIVCELFTDDNVIENKKVGFVKSLITSVNSSFVVNLDLNNYACKL